MHQLVIHVMINILFLFIVSLIAIAGLSQWKRMLVRLADRQPLFELRSIPRSSIGLLDLVAFFLIWSLLQLIAVGMLQAVLGIAVDKLQELGTNHSLWVVGTMASVQLIAIGISLAIFWWRYRDWALIGLGMSDWRLDLVWGVRFFVMVVPLILLLQWALSYLTEYQHDVFSMFDEGLNVTALVVAWFAAVLVAPITEEIFFRGLLQNWLQRVMDGRNHSVSQLLVGGESPMDRSQPKIVPFQETTGRAMEKVDDKSMSSISVSDPMDLGRSPGQSSPGQSYPTSATYTEDSDVPPLSLWPIGITSVLFGLVHYGQGLAPIPLFFFSIALGILYRRTGSLIPCLVLHAMLNGFSMFWFTVYLVGGTSLE